jgi:hypothetical protein
MLDSSHRHVLATHQFVTLKQQVENNVNEDIIFEPVIKPFNTQTSV